MPARASGGNPTVGMSSSSSKVSISASRFAKVKVLGAESGKLVRGEFVLAMAISLVVRPIRSSMSVVKIQPFFVDVSGHGDFHLKT